MDTSKERQALFLELASQGEGVTAQQVYEEALRRGDNVTIEAYHNLGRRLAHRGLLVPNGAAGRQTVFKVGATVDGEWLDEEQLAAIVDPEYPLIALTISREARRQLNSIPEGVWEELRARLAGVNAQELFVSEIRAYADDLANAFEQWDRHTSKSDSGLSQLKAEIDASIILLRQLTKYGLGLSNDAIRVPINFQAGLERFRQRPNEPLYDESLLRDEIGRRISNEAFVIDVEADDPKDSVLIAAVDGSTRGGLLTIEGEEGDFSIGTSPSVAINTAVGQVNRHVRQDGREYPAFLRLPEKPEDMQQQDNRYSIMAKLFFPDLSDSQYMHAVWNAMNLLESRAALKVMKRWYALKNQVEVRPADVILMDGPVTPQDRETSHYAHPGTYGKIVRDLIEANCEILQKSQADDQVVAGVVKNAQIRVFGPVINRYIANTIVRSGGQIETWPLAYMNNLSDQLILTRLLTAGRATTDPWHRTCFVMRPFHAATNYAERYTRNSGSRPADLMKRWASDAQARIANGTDFPEDAFWNDFLGDRDPYVKMLNGAWYVSFFLGAVPRLDQNQSLPRFELLLAADTAEEGGFKNKVHENADRLFQALKGNRFDVAAEHAMFGARHKIDVLPRLLIEVHYTVKVWASELLSRVQEYIGYHVSRYVKGGRARGVRIRPLRRSELETLKNQLTEERKRQAGELGSRSN